MYTLHGEDFDTNRRKKEERSSKFVLKQIQLFFCFFFLNKEKIKWKVRKKFSRKKNKLYEKLLRKRERKRERRKKKTTFAFSI